MEKCTPLIHKMEPHGDLSSTGYVLANPGEEYLVLQPSETADVGKVTVESPTSVSFSAPFEAATPVVLYLKQVRA